MGGPSCGKVNDRDVRRRARPLVVPVGTPARSRRRALTLRRGPGSAAARGDLASRLGTASVACRRPAYHGPPPAGAPCTVPRAAPFTPGGAPCTAGRSPGKHGMGFYRMTPVWIPITLLTAALDRLSAETRPNARSGLDRSTRTGSRPNIGGIPCDSEWPVGCECVVRLCDAGGCHQQSVGTSLADPPVRRRDLRAACRRPPLWPEWCGGGSRA